MSKLVPGSLELGLFTPQCPILINPEGLGSQKKFYRAVISGTGGVISHIYEKFAGRGSWPYLRVNCSVGNLKSGPKGYDAAVLRPGRDPGEYNLVFNQDNPGYLGEDGTAGTWCHEVVHMVSTSSGYKKLPEPEIEETNAEAFEKAGKKKIGKLIRAGSGYIGKHRSKSSYIKGTSN